jgi:hypothetical protein
LQVILLIVEASFGDRYQKKLSNKIKDYLKKEYREDVNIIAQVDSTPPDYLFGCFLIFGFIFSFWFFYHIQSHHWYMYVLFLVEASFSIIVFAAVAIATYRPKLSMGVKRYRVFNVIPAEKGKAEQKIDITKQFQNMLNSSVFYQEEKIIELDSVDYNDTQIARLESELKGINGKVDAYMIESVLLGGLSFSGYLTVVSGSLIGSNTDAFGNLLSHFNVFIRSYNIFDNTSKIDVISTFFQKEDLYVLIIFLCLISSVFFLLVLSLRLRYGSLAGNMDHLLLTMTIFNAKEEELTNMKYENANFASSQKDRLKKITEKIDLAIKDADHLMEELKPIISMMSLYRNVAIIVFYIVLIIAGFYFNVFIASSILIVAILTILFRWTESLLNLKRIRRLLLRH